MNDFKEKLLMKEFEKKNQLEQQKFNLKRKQSLKIKNIEIADVLK